AVAVAHKILDLFVTNFLRAPHPSLFDDEDPIYAFVLAEKDVILREYAEHGIAFQLGGHFRSQPTHKLEAFQRGISAVSSIGVVEVLAKLGELAKETQRRTMHLQHL